MKQIAVATDFSTRSDRALRRAVLLARQHNASLSLVHIVDNDRPEHLVRAQRHAAEELLEQTAATITREDGVPASIALTAGDAPAGILAAADEVEADLIILGPHRRKLRDIFAGTTAGRTVRESHRPVLMANAPPAQSYRRILLALDLDDVSRAAVETSRRLGLLDGPEVIALHLFGAPAVGLMDRTMEAQAAINLYVAEEQERVSDEFASFVSETGLQTGRQVLHPNHSSTASGILANAAEHDADLVVVGTSQPGAVDRFLIGSTANEVLLGAQQDVLVVPVGTAR